jgi:D-alanyl-D-alanine carboxypeptidase
MAQVRPILVGRSPQDRAADGNTNAAVTTIEALIEKSLHAEQPAPEHAEASALVPGPLTTARATPAAMPAAAAAPVLLAQPRLVRGSAPSTLEKQAMLLDRQAAPVLAAPINNGRPSGIEIQIGAFQSASEAQRQLAWVRQRASAVIGQHEAVTQPVKQGDKLFYRARFAGFDGAAAASACKELRALKVECLIMRSD